MEPEKKSNGALIGSIIIIIILIIGGIYIWQSQVKDTLDKDAKPLTATEKDATELNNLEKDINAADIDIGANVIDGIQ